MNNEKLIVSRLTSGIVKFKNLSLPQNIINIAKNLIIDISGVIFAGSKTKSAEIMYDLAKDTYGEGSCEIIGMKKFFNPAGAAFVNGALGHSLDFDDNCYAGVVHGSAVVFPAVLAYAQHNQLNGNDLIRSFIIGLETQFAVAKAYSNTIYHKGWWTTSVFGSLGSTAGVSSILNLDKNEIDNAISISLSCVGAIRAIRGTNAKHYYCGKSAENGIIACDIAKKGATGPIDVFEDGNGLLKILSDNQFDLNFINNLGNDFYLLNPGVDIKKYPVCYASHAAADGVKFLIDSYKIKIDEISSIICIVPQIIASNLTYKYPNSVKEAQFSLQFAIAIILKFGSIKLEHLDNKFIQDNSIKKLMKLVKMKVDILPKNISKNEVICPEWSNVQLVDNNGKSFEKFMGTPIGAAKKPLSQNMLFEKFNSCIQYSGVSKSAEKIYNKLLNIEKIENCRELYKV